MSVLILSLTSVWMIALAEISTSDDAKLQLLVSVVSFRSQPVQTEQITGSISEYAKDFKQEESVFEAARSKTQELVVCTRFLPKGLEEMKATLLRPDGSFKVFKPRNSRNSTVSTHPKSLQLDPFLLQKELGFDQKELHANLFEDYFFTEYLEPVMKKKEGYHLLDFHKQADGFNGTLFFEDSVKVLFRDESIDFVLKKDGHLKQWSYPLRFASDPKTYRSVIKFDRTPEGILRGVEQKYLDGETVGYRKIYTIKKHEVNVVLPADQFSLARFGFQEQRAVVPLLWVVFIVVTVVCLSSVAIYRRVLA